MPAFSNMSSAFACSHHRLSQHFVCRHLRLFKAHHDGRERRSRLMAPLDAVEARGHRDSLAGIKVRVGFNASAIPASSLSISRVKRPNRRTADDGAYRSSSANPRGRIWRACGLATFSPIASARFPTIPTQRMAACLAPSSTRAGVALFSTSAMAWARSHSRRRGDARQRLHARLHFERRACALHRWARFRSSDDDVEIFCLGMPLVEVIRAATEIRPKLCGAAISAL